MRETFNNTLPHPRTISKWFSKIDGSPGFTDQSFNFLKKMVAKNLEENKNLYCNLVMDEISIRKQIEWTGTKFTGFVNVGHDLDSEELPEAKEAIVFMVVAVNGNWKLPVGYFLINSLTGSEKASILNQLFFNLHATGVKILSLTFDGIASNISMIKTFGCDISNLNNLITHFPNPANGEMVYIMPDACHLLKLIRNSFNYFKVIQYDNKKIEWNYIQKLGDLQETEGLKLGNKLGKRHISFHNEKMKVKLAAQVFSKSVASALSFLAKDIKHKDFINADATAEFLLNINDLFDIFNSRNLLASYEYKRGINATNYFKIFERLDEIINYLKSLKLITGKNILESSRKLGYLGFLIGAINLKNIFYRYVIDCKISFLLTYKFSQDHLELFFSAIRSMGGLNNNPNARQFEAAYKRLLVHADVKASQNANVSAIDETSILYLPSTSLLKKENIDEVEEVDDITLSDNIVLTLVGENIVTYIAGFVVKKLKKKINCDNCISMLEQDNKQLEEDCFSNKQRYLLLKRKVFGQLTNATNFVVKLCLKTERVIKELKNLNKLFIKNIENLIISKVFETTNIYSLIAPFDNHVFNFDVLDSHPHQLCTLIIKYYVKIRVHHECKLKNQYEKRVRHKLTKTILFQNQ